MTRLFAENFSIEPSDAAAVPLEPTYDEARSLSLDSRGRAFVDIASSAALGTLTEVRGESSDPDDEDELSLRTGTFTKVRGERPDAAAEAVDYLGTETKEPVKRASGVPGERDFSSHEIVELTTKTQVRGESDSWSELPSPQLTLTAGRMRGVDQSANWNGTDTAVRQEKETDCAADELALELASRQPGAPGQ